MVRRAETREIEPTTPFDCVRPADLENAEALALAGKSYQDDPARELADLEAGRHPLQKRKPRPR